MNLFKPYGMLLLTAVVTMLQIVTAAGTTAGTVIQSRSKVVYTSGTLESDTVYSNEVSFVVAQVASVNVSPVSNASTTGRDSVYAEYPLTVTNSGNGEDRFTLGSVSSKGWTAAFYSDVNGDGALQTGELSAGPVTRTALLVADAADHIIVRVFVPRDPALNGATDTTTIAMTSQFNAARSITATMRTTVKTANLSGLGSGLMVTPSDPTPGQTVTYSITFTNTGSVTATSVSITDLVNAGQFSIVSGSTSQGTVNTSGNPVLWTIGSVAPGGSVTVSVVLQVSNGLSTGTNLVNTLTIGYSVGGASFSINTNIPTATIGVTRSVSIAPSTMNAQTEMEDTLFYPLTVRNLGNAKDVLELERTSTKNFIWSFFKDVDNNGVWSAADIALSNTNRTGGVDVDSVAAFDSVKVLARLIVPLVTVDRTQDVTTFTVRSSTDNSKFQNATATTVVNTPDLVVNRSVTPAGEQPPGTEMTFSVTYQNIGHGKAYLSSFTETEPDNMTYVANSVRVNDIAKTDADDGDGVSVTTVSGKKVITIVVGTVDGNSAAGTITYTASIK